MVAAVLVMATGCTKDPQSTPKGTVIKMYDAMMDNSKASFMECLKVTDEQKPLAEGMFDMGVGMHSLQEAVRKEYGDDGLAAFAKAAGGNQDKGMTFPTRDDVKKATVKIDGDTATALVPGEDKPMTLVKENGKWYATLPAEMTQGPGAAMAVKMMGPMAKAIDTTKAMVGKDGQTPETLGTAFTAEMMKAAMGAMMGPEGDVMKKMMEGMMKEGMQPSAQPPR